MEPATGGIHKSLSSLFCLKPTCCNKPLSVRSRASLALYPCPCVTVRELMWASWVVCVGCCWFYTQHLTHTHTKRLMDGVISISRPHPRGTRHMVLMSLKRPRGSRDKSSICISQGEREKLTICPQHTPEGCVCERARFIWCTLQYMSEKKKCVNTALEKKEKKTTIMHIRMMAMILMVHVEDGERYSSSSLSLNMLKTATSSLKLAAWCHRWQCILCKWRWCR